MRRVVLDQKERFGEWARTRIPHVDSWGEWYEAIGLEEDGEPIAAVIYNLYSGADIAMHIAGAPGRRWLNREFLRVAFRYPFVQLGCRRVSGYVPATNADALRFDRHIGFVDEGVMREALPNGEDVVVLGMLKNECKWWH